MFNFPKDNVDAPLLMLLLLLLLFQLLENAAFSQPSQGNFLTYFTIESVCWVCGSVCAWPCLCGCNSAAEKVSPFRDEKLAKTNSHPRGWGWMF